MGDFQIFISYSRRNIDQVMRIREEMESVTGARCWMDLKAIESGSKRFTTEIIDGINNCNVFLFMLSEDSQHSEFALRELDFADKKGKHVVIVNIKDCAMTDEFQFLYGLTDTINWNDPQQHDKLLRDLKRWIEVPDTTSETVPIVEDGHVETKSKGKSLLWIVVGAVMVVAVALFLMWYYRTTSTQETSTPPIVEAPSPDSEIEIVANDVSFVMKFLEGGTFQMGNAEKDAYNDEIPVHVVTIDSFYMCETEVTQALWKAVMGNEPTFNGGWEDNCGKGDNYPAYRVSWNDVKVFLSKLNQMTGKDFRLPTEAEWEFAARGGNRSEGNKYSGSNAVGDVAWYSDNAGKQTHPVKTKQANELGLYDMSGNVWEWCSDWYGRYGSADQVNPTGPSKGSERILRGGGWYGNARNCRVTDRITSNPDDKFNGIGFRIALSN